MTSFDSNLSSGNEPVGHQSENRLLPAELQGPVTAKYALLRTGDTTTQGTGTTDYSMGQVGGQTQTDTPVPVTQTSMPQDGTVITGRSVYGSVAPGALAATAPTDGTNGQYQPTAPMQPGSPWEAQRQQQQQQQQQITGDGSSQGQTPFSVGNGQIQQQQQQVVTDQSGRTGNLDQYTTPTDKGSASSSSGGGGSMFGGMLGSGLSLGASLYARNKFLTGAGAEFATGEAFSKEMLTKANLMDQTKAPLTKALLGGWLGNELMDHTILAGKDSSWKTLAVDVAAPFLATTVFGKTGGLVKPLATMMGAHFLEKTFLEGDKQK